VPRLAEVGRPRRAFRRTKEDKAVDWKLEVVVVPVSDVDRAQDAFSDPGGTGWLVQEARRTG